MRQYMEQQLNIGDYLAPEVEVIVVKSQGILCISGEGESGFKRFSDPDWFA